MGLLPLRGAEGTASRRRREQGAAARRTRSPPAKPPGPPLEPSPRSPGWGIPLTCTTWAPRRLPKATPSCVATCCCPMGRTPRRRSSAQWRGLATGRAPHWRDPISPLPGRGRGRCPPIGPPSRCAWAGGSLQRAGHLWRRQWQHQRPQRREGRRRRRRQRRRMAGLAPALRALLAHSALLPRLARLQLPGHRRCLDAGERFRPGQGGRSARPGPLLPAPPRAFPRRTRRCSHRGGCLPGCWCGFWRGCWPHSPCRCLRSGTCSGTRTRTFKAGCRRVPSRSESLSRCWFGRSWRCSSSPPRAPAAAFLFLCWLWRLGGTPRTRAPTQAPVTQGTSRSGRSGSRRGARLPTTPPCWLAQAAAATPTRRFRVLLRVPLACVWGAARREHFPHAIAVACSHVRFERMVRLWPARSSAAAP
mmetsp:Transcript_13521/g.51574  ORF Transcript_13521/g.51574 Transcript_13521/m.51574 type:complete len:418 (-) Transcript_13521:7-1260(-)